MKFNSTRTILCVRAGVEANVQNAYTIFKFYFRKENGTFLKVSDRATINSLHEGQNHKLQVEMTCSHEQERKCWPWFTMGHTRHLFEKKVHSTYVA